eukprot:7142438-Alexandrium_andersonii.AAC.1
MRSMRAWPSPARGSFWYPATKINTSTGLAMPARARALLSPTSPTALHGASGGFDHSKLQRRCDASRGGTPHDAFGALSARGDLGRRPTCIAVARRSAKDMMGKAERAATPPFRASVNHQPRGHAVLTCSERCGQSMGNRAHL